MTFVAIMEAASTAKSVMPFSQKVSNPILYDTPDPIHLYRPEAAGRLEAYGAQPELGFEVVPFDVDVRRLLPI